MTPPDERLAVTADGTRHAVTVRRGARSTADASTVTVTVGDGTAHRVVVVGQTPGQVVVSVDDRTLVVHVARQGTAVQAMVDGERFDVDRHEEAQAADTPDELSSPMPATVTAVLVALGAEVDAGDPLVRLEAMKMEQTIRAPFAGRVTAIECREGELVDAGRALVAVTPA